MPIIKSALKKMRQDKKRTAYNKVRREKVKEFIKKAQKNPTPQNIKFAQSAIDKLAKVKVIHKNKAARLKARLSKLTKQAAKSKEIKATKKRKTKHKA